MPSGFYVLLRLFLRVDEVMVRVIDTRYHHEFGTTYVLREFTEKEATLAELKVRSLIFPKFQTLPFHGYSPLFL